MEKKYRAKLSPSLSKRKEERYVMVDTETGEIVDDCRGYGFKSKHAAYACFGYKYTRMKRGEAFS
ncbi:MULTISPECIES: hypothetical protein [Enterococcus]|uniref:Uncharacterized protein n=1 Tax=Enterococcus faecium TaxID=1352 RepID=A0A9X3XS86_ENTFC|nr:MULTISPECIES: hypothetical protein [Enterococcus]EGP4752427.1 hypothetical protein [Enterococcus faecium]EJG4482905.1 hypothetical protein [Enterococcus faecalis]EKL7559085.1 hypothetical protein [Enterococcus faecalis]EMF0346860.1 hypothetical protein [Enterococcus faecium]MBO1103672.1 hypothetical protein [Enterococcus hirae]